MTRSYRERAPVPSIAPFVACHWSSEVLAGEDAAHPVHPDGCIDLLFDAAAGRLEIVGTMTRTLWVEGRGPSAHAGVRFAPGGAVPFLREHAERFTDRALAAADVLGPSARELEARLTGAGSLAEAQALLESYLIARLSEIDPIDRRVAHAASRLTRDPAVRVDTIAGELGLTRQHLRRLFLEHVGVTPKVLARTSRAVRIARAIDASAPLTRAALDAGYADQAHMSRELRRVIGMTPSAYRARRDRAALFSTAEAR